MASHFVEILLTDMTIFHKIQRAHPSAKVVMAVLGIFAGIAFCTVLSRVLAYGLHAWVFHDYWPIATRASTLKPIKSDYDETYLLISTFAVTVSLCTLFVTALGFLGAILSIKELSRQTQISARSAKQNASTAISQQISSSMQILIDDPSLRPYFYDGTLPDPKSGNHDKIQLVTEHLLDVYDSVLMHMEEYEPVFKSQQWQIFVGEMLSNCQHMRDYLRKHRAWYERETKPDLPFLLGQFENRWNLDEQLIMDRLKGEEVEDIAQKIKDAKENTGYLRNLGWEYNQSLCDAIGKDGVTILAIRDKTSHNEPIALLGLRPALKPHAITESTWPWSANNEWTRVCRLIFFVMAEDDRKNQSISRALLTWCACLYCRQLDIALPSKNSLSLHADPIRIPTFVEIEPHSKPTVRISIDRRGNGQFRGPFDFERY
jgi:hypothetical protein